jgi:Ca2+-binding RTX toxin-like protein
MGIMALGDASLTDQIKWNSAMLFLAGLMGLMAVGAAAFVDIGSDDDDDDGDPQIDDTGRVAGQIVSGSNQNDFLEGSWGDDQIGGGDGNDLINGNDGYDYVRGDKGNDTVDGGAGHDNLHGNDGDDEIDGGAEDDTLTGHNGNDVLRGNSGNDSLNGSAGDDALFGDDGDDALMGGLGNDFLSGGRGQDALFGGWGDDLIVGVEYDPQSIGITDEDSADFLNGGGGVDTIVAGQNDVVTAGDGADNIIFGDWITAGNAAIIEDYVAKDDSLLFVWDDSKTDSEEPQITVEPDPDNPDQTLVRMDGTVVACVKSPDVLNASDISIVPLSSAIFAGLAFASA